MQGLSVYSHTGAETKPQAPVFVLNAAPHRVLKEVIMAKERDTFKAGP